MTRRQCNETCPVYDTQAEQGHRCGHRLGTLWGRGTSEGLCTMAAYEDAVRAAQRHNAESPVVARTVALTILQITLARALTDLEHWPH